MTRHGMTSRFAYLLILTAALPGQALAQIPGLPSTPPAAEKAKDNKPAPTRDNPEAKVATGATPIEVTTPVGDEPLESTLNKLLPQYPGVRSVDITVDDGVVRLEGLIEDAGTRDDVTEFTRRVQGVRLVLNRMKTDAQVMTGTQLALDVLRHIAATVSRNWLVVIVALVLVVAFSTAAQLFNRYSETLLAPFLRNVMLRSVVGSLIGSGLVLAGVLSALSILNLTHAVLSILGLASIVGLAVGFAFRDIAENFIASVLLGLRRPFQVGDYVTVAGHAGVVRSLNTRATVLVTLEGNHVRIPNNVIYKEILVNSTASPSFRGSFDVIVPYEASTAAALEAVDKALGEVNGIMADPPARALVEALEPGGVRLRTYYWTPVRGVDWFQVHSDARLRVKVALQKANVLVNPPAAAPAPAPAPSKNGDDAGHTPPAEATVGNNGVTRSQAAANLARDARASANADATTDDGSRSPVDHVLQAHETCVTEEGANLLGGACPRPAETGGPAPKDREKENADEAARQPAGAA